MKGVNKAIVLGNLGKEPEVFKTTSGATITSISVATSESWKDKNTGEQQTRTEWHKIKFFGKLADVASQYLQKGSKVYVEGKLMTEKYQAGDGTDRYSTCIVAQQFQMLDKKPEGSGQYQQPAQQQQQQQQQEPDFDDDIPF